MRTLVLVDGQHHPSVVRAAIEQLPSQVPGCRVVGAALLSGGEKLDRPDDLDLGVPVSDGASPDDVLTKAMLRCHPELIVDLSDEPVLDARARMRLAARALAAGVPYQGADFRLDPPPRPRVATKPSVAVVGTGKRTGKTAVAVQVARVLAERGRPPVIVAMGRGGPPEPELLDPREVDLSVPGLLALAERGRHAATDHVEDAVMARVATVGTRRCGGGLAGAPGDSTFVEGVRLANGRPEPLLVLEGSGSAIPPVEADATVCVVPAGADPELVTGYLGAYRLLLSDLVVATMAEPSLGASGAGASQESLSKLEGSIRGLAPGVRVVHTVFRPRPLESVSGRRVFYVTTAPASAGEVLTEHLEHEHGCRVVGTSHHLAHRQELAEDLREMPEADVLLVELKAAAVDLAAKVALRRGMEVALCDNQVVTTGGDGTFEELTVGTADLAVERFNAR